MDIDERSRIVTRFCHSLLMVSKLIPATDEPELAGFLRLACLDSWFVNFRLLAEFLVMPGRPNRVAARSLAPSWDAGANKSVTMLKREYGWTSEHIVHIGTPKASELSQNVAPDILRVKTSLLLDVVDDFNSAVREADDELGLLILSAADQARSALEA